MTVKDAIGNLPPLEAYWDDKHHQEKISHSTPICNLTWHEPRYSNARDMDTFRILAEDIETGKREYDSKK